RAADLTGTASVTFKNVDGINDVTIEPVKLTNGKGDVSASTGLGALAEAINKASDKTGIKANVTAISTFEQPIKAGETTSNFSINGVKIGTVSVQEKDANGALRAAINAVKDQTGVEASVDTKGRLVLSNRDGRGIKVEDNVTANKPAADLHSLVTQGATPDSKFKKGVDLNKAATWTTAAGTEGSILVKENSFGDVKNAHGVQDALIYEDGKTKAVNNSVPYQEYKKFQDVQNEAIDKLKNDLIDKLKSDILDKTALAGQGTQKTALDGHANTAINSIKNATNLEAISNALTTLDGNLGTAQAAIGVSQDNFQTAFASAVKDYATTIDLAGKAVQKNMKEAGVDVTQGDAQTLNNELNTLLGATATALTANNGLNHATAATAFGAIATLATPDTTFTTNVAALAGKEVNFGNLAVENIGALNLSLKGAAGANDPVAQDILTSFKELRTQTTVDGANAKIDEINKKLEKVIADAEGKTMDTKEAQQGMIAHSYMKFFAGVKAGLNEPNKAGLSSIVGLNTENSTNMGRLSLVSNNGRDIQVEVKDANGFTTNSAIGYDKNVSEATVSLRETNATISRAQADAMGYNNEEWQAGDNGDNQNGYAAGVMT
ncbi:hypothetical protein AVBRAN9334_09995, partial [Campylobacter sp. RM9334]|uniref:flagellin hook IN motif-containing protein n=1 Tax=Campylobacter sp. RM9334 TaxID=2735732 RepID=UPI001D8BEA07|nr:hypothetical protein [Campylobacter sp. RM9334]